MGQTISTPAGFSHPPHPRHDVTSPMVEAPSGWKSDSQQLFQLVSPVSDISNPSQFRHRHQVAVVDGSDPTSGGAAYNNNNNSRRVSKVCSTSRTPGRHQQRRRSRSLPPMRFYFGNDGDNEPSGGRTRSSANNATIGDVPWRASHAKFKKKCAKIKRTMTECWKERRASPVMGGEDVVASPVVLVAARERTGRAHARTGHAVLSDTSSAKREEAVANQELKAVPPDHEGREILVPMLYQNKRDSGHTDLSQHPQQDYHQRSRRSDGESSRTSSDDPLSLMPSLVPSDSSAVAARRSGSLQSRPSRRSSEGGSSKQDEDDQSPGYLQLETSALHLVSKLGKVALVHDSIDSFDALHFQPVWKEERGMFVPNSGTRMGIDDVSTYLHSPEEYLQRLVAVPSTSTKGSATSPKHHSPTVYHSSRKSGSLMEEGSAHSQRMASPVTALFTTSHSTNEPLGPYDESHPPATMLLRKQAISPHQRSQESRATTLEVLSVAQKLEDGPVDDSVTKRASLSLRFSIEMGDHRDNMHDEYNEKRQSIEMEVQRQINEQTNENKGSRETQNRDTVHNERKRQSIDTEVQRQINREHTKSDEPDNRDSYFLKSDTLESTGARQARDPHAMNNEHNENRQSIPTEVQRDEMRNQESNVAKSDASGGPRSGIDTTQAMQQKTAKESASIPRYDIVSTLDKENALNGNKSSDIPGRSSISSELVSRSGHIATTSTRVHATRLRASSLPNRDLTGRNSSVQPRRWSSNPRRYSIPVKRDSTNISGLLCLAGWEARSTQAESESMKLPVLLQLAGWGSTESARQGPGLGASDAMWLPTSKSSSDSMKNSITARAHIQRAPAKEFPKTAVPILDENGTVTGTKRLHLKESRASDPLPIYGSHEKRLLLNMKQRQRKSLTTIASILQQTSVLKECIPAIENCDDGHNMEASAFRPRACATQHVDYRLIALGSALSPAKSLKQGEGASSESPAHSIDSTSTTSSVPLVSNQALSNAAFLFSPSYASGDASLLQPPAARREQPSFTISTLDSRIRVSSLTSNANSIPFPITQSSSLDAEETGSIRRVRFSDADEVISIGKIESSETTKTETVLIHVIESKLSDLSDTSRPERSDSSLMETENPSVTSQQGIVSNSLSSMVDMHEKQEQPALQWGYYKMESMDDGVTPLRSGRNSGLATNSPSVRFIEARTTFSPTSSKKIVPVKRPILVKKGASGLVHSRILAMEARKHSIISDKSTEAQGKKSRRATSGHMVIAPKKATLVSPLFKRHGSLPSQVEEQVHDTADGQDRVPEVSSPMVVGGEFINSPRDDLSVPPMERMPSVESSGIGEDRIFKGSDNDLKPKNSGDKDSTYKWSDTDLKPRKSYAKSNDKISKGSDTDLKSKKSDVVSINLWSGDDSSDDDFDQLLNYQNSDVESSFDDETVSTVRQDKSATIGSEFSSYRVSKGGSSIVTSSTSGSTDDTISTIRQRRLSLASGSENTLSHNSVDHRQTRKLPFRQDAPVKPTEQNHHTVPGTLCLSPVQRTPSQARKWRDLAAAAQDRDSKRTLLTNKKTPGASKSNRSLSERNRNVLVTNMN